MYSYTDPCTRELKTLTYDMSAPVVVSYYGRVRAFTYNEIQNGVFDAWINDIFSQVQTSPCQGVLTSTTTTSTTNLTTNIINTVLNLNSITAITSIGGISNNLGGTVNLGSNSNNNNNEQNNNSNNSNSNSNNASSNSPSSNSSNGNNGSGSGNDNSNNSNPPGGGNTGENSGGSGTGGGTSGSEKEKTTPSQEEIKETKTEEQKSSSNNVSKSTSKAKTETQKPAILLTGDIVGLQKTEDGSQDARGTFSYTRVKGDGSASLGLSADYMLRAKISNVTVMRSWIGTKDNGNKHINLISSGFSMMPGSVSNTSMFIRINSLKRFTALYGAAASYGKLYQEELISGLAIAGFMYKGKIAKKIDGTIIAAGVYSPYTKYYTTDWFKSRPIIVPFFNFNYKMTKTFGIGLTGGTTYMAGQNVLNYQVLCGAKLIL